MKKTRNSLRLFFLLFMSQGASLFASETVAIAKKSSVSEKLQKRLLNKSILGYDIQPLFPALKKRKTETEDVVEIARYFVHHIKTGIPELDFGPFMVADTTKINDLLYCAQGYALAIENQELFSSKFSNILSYSIPVVVHEASQLESKPFISEESIPSGSCKNYSDTQKNHFNIILQLQGMGLLRRKSYLKNKEGFPTDAKLMKQFFRKPIWWANYMVRRLWYQDSEEARKDVIQYIREYLSYNCLPREDIIQIHDVFRKFLTEQKDLSEETMKEWLSCLDMPVKWPDQTYFQALMGYLFFPIPYETYYEYPSARHLKYLLAISASYDNLLAIREVADVLKIYDESYHSHSDDESMQEELEQVQKYFGEKIMARIHKYTHELSSEENLPVFYCGRLCLADGMVRMAKKYFKKGYELGNEKNGYCAYQYAQTLDVQSLEDSSVEKEKQVVLKNLLSMNPGLAKMMHASIEADRRKRISLYEKAGELGIPKGYKIAGLLCGNTEKERAYSNFALAAQHHMLSAYDKIARMLLEEAGLYESNNEKKPYREKAKEAYRFKGESGKSSGYLKLGRLYLDEQKSEEAGRYFKKARLDGLSTPCLGIKRAWEEKNIARLKGNADLEELLELITIGKIVKHEVPKIGVNGQSPEKIVKGNSTGLTHKLFSLVTEKVAEEIVESQKLKYSGDGSTNNSEKVVVN